MTNEEMRMYNSKSFWDSVGIKPTKRLKNIMSFLATGWLPWGIEWKHNNAEIPVLPLCGREYIMCCGHTMKQKEVDRFISAGLFEAGPADVFGRQTVRITDRGRKWLSWHW